MKFNVILSFLAVGVSAISSQVAFSTCPVPCDGRYCRGEKQLTPSGAPDYKEGDSDTQPPETLGFAVDHVAILVNDFDESLKWYREVLGLRIAVKLEFDVYKLVHLEFPNSDSISGQNNARIELLWYKNYNHKSVPKFGRFSHFSLSVPNIKNFEKRIDENTDSKVKIKWLKRPGASVDGEKNDLAEFLGLPGPVPAWLGLPKDTRGFLEDPNGVMIDVFERS